jgi:flagellar hook protein FlgE
LTSLTVDKYGNVIGTYGDGSTEILASVSLAGFKNPAGLQRVGHNLWAATAAAGAPVYGLPGGAEGLGTIEAGALEQANVDLAQEFVNMINYQRAYQANSKSITTSDEMLKTAINLKS